MYGPMIATFIMSFLIFVLGLIGIDPNTKKIFIGVILILTILVSTINRQMIKDMKLRMVYHNNKNIEAVNDRTGGNAEQIKKLQNEIAAAQKECREKTAQFWADQQADEKKAKERFAK